VQTERKGGLFPCLLCYLLLNPPQLGIVTGVTNQLNTRRLSSDEFTQ